MTITWKSLLVLLVALSGCAALTRHTLNEEYGSPDPARFDTPAAPPPGFSYRKDVQPILERRCVVCHACYDGPCQLKFTAWEGVARGTSKEQVYDSGRLLEAQPTRLFTDAQSASQWRAKGFSAVLNEREQTPTANLAASVLYRALKLKQDHPLPPTAILPKTFDFSLDRAQQCPRIDEYDAFERKNPLWGMPFGLPGLSDGQLATLSRWLELGAPFEGLPALPAQLGQQVADWETFLNGDSLKQRLVSRYIYEHLFLAHLYFDSDAQHHYFRMVRSRTPPGQPIDLIASRRPYDDPGVERVYYRLEREQETIVDKTHLPYALGAKRMARWRQLFLDSDYAVDELPSYALQVASNPFVTFQALPTSARYQFMRDEAEFTIMGFIKGPVCRGQVALNVIEDRFWVFFLADTDLQDKAGEFLDRESSLLALPAAQGSDAKVIGPWRDYAKLQAKYLQAKSKFLDHYAATSTGPTLQWIWNGDGNNPNAALTVFRHFDNASVVKGLVGGPPKTAWVIGYGLLERIHYLLVAGYDVYGNVGHQLLSRLYMDFLRMEGEFNFIAYLPRDDRKAVRDFWYRGASQEVKDHVYGTLASFDVQTGIRYRTDDPQQELYSMLQSRLAPVLEHQYDLSQVADAALRKDLAALAALRGAALSWIPEVVFVRLEDPPRPPRYFTLLRNTGHRSVSSLLQEGRELLPAENTMTVVPGFIGAYPSAIYRLQRSEIKALADTIGGLSSEADYRALADRFVVRRSDPAFWQASDELQDAHLRSSPVSAGLLDYNRLENR
ncbi:MAG TPA: fatty acid cis/trans isomerase [Accumulibacter sp.]|uniref:fatty acid cis/trans isomerase n=1 Tax=Accumulibacter sp. TaxID=2053492 RepID=UPI002C6B3DEB|nr:fatty acid cis/trans isomerase [Accumulibacter sp.]HRF73438.1 fatty acid cis/trans isomerase [Accumulibacter sp.]